MNQSAQTCLIQLMKTKKSLNNFSYLYNNFKNSNNASNEDDFQVFALLASFVTNNHFIFVIIIVIDIFVILV